MGKTINCSILTPEQTLYEGEVSGVQVQAYDGSMGFLPGHAPLIAELGVGELKLTGTEGSAEYFAVEGGIVEISGNKLIVLAENAFTKDSLDSGELEGRLSELEGQNGRLAEIRFEREKLKARLKVALK